MIPGRSASAVAFLVFATGAAAGTIHGSGRLSVHQVIAKGAPLYVEGSVGYVRLKGPGGPETRRLNANGWGKLQLRAGRYTLKSWQRVCNGNCDRLGPPSDRCSRVFKARKHARLRAKVVLTPGRGCTITVSER